MDNDKKVQVWDQLITGMAEDLKAYLAEELFCLRHELNMTTEEFALRSNIAPERMKLLENGAEWPTMDELVRIALLWDKSIDDLLNLSIVKYVPFNELYAELLATGHSYEYYRKRIWLEILKRVGITQQYSWLYDPEHYQKSVCFLGYEPDRYIIEDKEASEQLKIGLGRQLITLYEDGYRFFITGARPGFDLTCARLVVGLQHMFPEIRLIAVLPFDDYRLSNTFEEYWHKGYIYVEDRCNELLTPSGKSEYFDGSLEKNQEFMLSHCSAALCLADDPNAVTQGAIHYAMANKNRIIYYEGSSGQQETTA